MVDTSLNSSMISVLRETIGTQLVSLECLKLDKFNHTFECAAITTSISRIEFTDEEQSIAYFGAMEDWPILTCRTIPNEATMRPSSTKRCTGTHCWERYKTSTSPMRR